MDIVTASITLLICPVISFAWFATDASAWTIYDILVGIWRESGSNYKYLVTRVRIPGIGWRIFAAVFLFTCQFLIAIPLVAYSLTNSIVGFGIVNVSFFVIASVVCAFLPQWWKACTILRVRREVCAAKEVLEQILDSDRRGVATIEVKNVDYTAKFSRQSIPTTFMLKRSQKKYDWHERIGPIGVVLDDRVLVEVSLGNGLAVELWLDDHQPSAFEFTEDNCPSNEDAAWRFDLIWYWRVAPRIYLSKYDVRYEPVLLQK